MKLTRNTSLTVLRRFLWGIALGMLGLALFIMAPAAGGLLAALAGTVLLFCGILSLAFALAGILAAPFDRD